MEELIAKGFTLFTINMRLRAGITGAREMGENHDP
jgi:hypothetical protein